MPGKKKLFLDITSPRRTSPKVSVPEGTLNSNSEDVSKYLCHSAYLQLNYRLSNSVPQALPAILQDGQCCMQGSLRVTDNGSFNVYSKSQEYKFTPDGLTRKGGRKAAQPVDNQLSYKVPVCLSFYVSS